MAEVTGASIALLSGSSIVVFRRDNKPDLAFAGMLDLIGGAREDDETPEQCIVRETFEETGVDLDQVSILWQKDYPFLYRSGVARFMVAEIDKTELKLGDEGISVEYMPITEFIARTDVVSAQQERLKDYLGYISAQTAAA